MIQSGVAALEKGDGHSLRTALWLESSGALCIRYYHLDGVLGPAAASALAPVAGVTGQTTSLVSRSGLPPGGTGLSLATCRRLWRLLGADIVVTSDTGAGMTITVTLPMSIQGF